MTQKEIDMSSEAITRRLMQVEQLRRLCLALAPDQQSLADHATAGTERDEPAKPSE